MSIQVKIFAIITLCLAGFLSGWPGAGAGVAGVPVVRSADINPGDHAKVWSSDSEVSAFTGMTDSPLMTGTTSAYVEDWPLHIINLASVTGSVSAPVIVAVLDTGIDASHEELVGRIATHICFVENGEVNDKLGHGTFIAGVIAADDENGIGVAGLAPDCLLLNVKVADDKGLCRQSDLVEGIIWAVDQGAKVINISIELSSYTSALEEAIEYAWQNGAIVIAAAGNEGNSTPVYPAALDNCLSITGIEEDMGIAPLANYGDWVDAAAPGFKIYGVLPGDSYGYQYGTSFAAAFVSGLAARLFPLAIDANADGRLNDEVRNAILAGCRPLGDDGTGYGLIDVAASQEYLLNLSN